MGDMDDVVVVLFQKGGTWMIESIVKITGVLTIIFIAACLIYFALIFTAHYTLAKTQSLKFLAKRIWNFYTTLPEHKREYPDYPYVICVFERKTGKIIMSEELTADLRDRTEVKNQFAELRKKLAKGRCTNER
jgi:hypothetical protein